MSTLLEHPQARTFSIRPTSPLDDVRACARHLTGFIQRYLLCFYRDEQRGHADTILRGKRSGLRHKPPSRLPPRPGRNADPCSTSSAPAGETTPPSARNSAATSVRNWATL